MKEIIITGLYWFANILLLLWSVLLAFSIWNKNRRLLKAIILIVAGFVWHGIRAIYSFNNNSCMNITGSENLLILANKCIPPTDVDVIYAQAAILVGLFVIIGEIYKRYADERR